MAADHIVIFDIAEWRELYPQYEGVSDIQLGFLWEIACSLIGNTPASRIPYDPPRSSRRKIILYGTLCHLAYLQQRGDIVGNVTSATQGSVNAGFAYQVKDNSRWWEQSQCGAMVWQLLAPSRRGGLYVRGR
jgi:hypothetical protein